MKQMEEREYHKKKAKGYNTNTYNTIEDNCNKGNCIHIVITNIQLIY